MAHRKIDFMNRSQELVDMFFGRMKWSYWDLKSQGLALAEESGEVAKEINALGAKPKKKSDVSTLKKELGDAYFTLCCIANSQGISLSEALVGSIEEKEERDKNRHKRKK